MLPAKSTPGATMISLSGMTATAAPAVATSAAASEPRGVFLTSIRSAIPRRGNRLAVSQMPLVLAGTATILALSKNLFERFDGAHVGFWRACTHRDTEADLSKIDVGSGDDPDPVVTLKPLVRMKSGNSWS